MASAPAAETIRANLAAVAAKAQSSIAPSTIINHANFQNERENISPKELKLYQRFAGELLGLTEEQIVLALAAHSLMELKNDPTN
ncbi:MAG TPA: hypothetical protein VIK56_04825 [Rhodoferax sp.]